MKRNSKQDWTRVLQERLQDAELAAPPFADLVGGSPEPVRKSPVMAGPPLHHVPWPWALAGVAAVLVAAILLFRPAPSGPAHPSSPDPEPLIAQNTPSAAPSSPSVPAPAAPVAQGVPSSVSGTPSSVPDLPSSVPDLPSSSAGTPSSFAGLTGEPPTVTDEPPAPPAPPEAAVTVVPAPSGADTPAADPAGVAGNTPSTDWTGEAPAARRKPRLALRVHAATAGMPAKSGGTSFRTFSWVEDQYVYTNDGLSLSSSVSLNAVNGTNQPMIVTYKEETYRFIPVEWVPTLPVSFGVSAELDLARHWALTLGLDYTQRAGYWLRDDVPQSLSLHYLGLPLEAHYLFWPESRFRLYLGAGLKVEKCILATGGEPLRDPFLLSWNLQGGADYRFLPGVRVYLAPVLSQYVNHSTYVNTWDDRFQLQLRVGLSFDVK